ncbi:cysteine desulfurase, partial [Tulasnella sp. 425]
TVGADAKDIVVTSSATELHHHHPNGSRMLLDSYRKFSEEGFEITYLPVQKNGVVDFEVLKAAIRPTTSLVSIIVINTQTGVIQPLKDIVETVKQQEGRLLPHRCRSGPWQYRYLCQRDEDRLAERSQDLWNEFIGACHERGLRSGTLPGPLVVGLGAAARIAKQEIAADNAHISKLSKRLINGINSRVEHVVRNGDVNGFPGCVNLSFLYVEGETLLMTLKVR